MFKIFINLFLPLLLFLIGCASYIKKSTFEDYKRTHAIEHNSVEMDILFNKDRVENHVYDFNMFKDASRQAAEETNRKFEQEINDLMWPSCILYLSPEKFEVHFGTYGVRVIEIIGE